jgi:hypothetical protein
MNVQPRKDKINTDESYHCNKNLFESNEDFIQTEKFIRSLIKSNILNSDFFLNNRTINILCTILENITHKDISGMYPTTFLDVKFIIQDLSSFNSINPILNQTSISNFIKANFDEILTNMGEQGKAIFNFNLGGTKDGAFKNEIDDVIGEIDYEDEDNEIDEEENVTYTVSRVERARIVSKLEYNITADFFTSLSRIVEKLFIDGVTRSNSLPTTFQEFQLIFALYSIFNQELALSLEMPFGNCTHRKLLTSISTIKKLFDLNIDRPQLFNDPRLTLNSSAKIIREELKLNKQKFDLLSEHITPTYQEKLKTFVNSENIDQVPVRSYFEDRLNILNKFEYAVTTSCLTPLTNMIEKLFVDGIIKSKDLPKTFQEFQITYLLYSIFNEELSASTSFPEGVYNLKNLKTGYSRVKDIFSLNPDQLPIADPKKTTLATRKSMTRKLKYDKDLYKQFIEYITSEYQEKLDLLIRGKDDNLNEVIEIPEGKYSGDLKTLLNRLDKLQQSNLLTKKNIEVLQDLFETTELEINTIKDRLLNK